MAEEHYLEVNIYPAPNPALSEILIGDRMAGIVSDYTEKVRQSYIAAQAARPRIGDKHPGLSAASAEATVHVGGDKNDRYIGEVTVNVPYAGADEWGRHAYSPYGPHHDLVNALHTVLPYKP